MFGVVVRARVILMLMVMGLWCKGFRLDFGGPTVRYYRGHMVEVKSWG